MEPEAALVRGQASCLFSECNWWWEASMSSTTWPVPVVAADRRHTAWRTGAIASHRGGQEPSVDVTERALQRRSQWHRPEHDWLGSQRLDVAARLAAPSEH
jgi:hypothetical protein